MATSLFMIQSVTHLVCGLEMVFHERCSGQTLVSMATLRIWITSMPNKENCRCRVCGLLQDQPPWGDDGLTPSFNICPCCGAEFGYHDATMKAIKTHRTKWLSTGAKWFVPNKKPNGWSLEKQLKQIQAVPPV